MESMKTGLLLKHFLIFKHQIEKTVSQNIKAGSNLEELSWKPLFETYIKFLVEQINIGSYMTMFLNKDCFSKFKKTLSNFLVPRMCLDLVWEVINLSNSHLVYFLVLRKDKKWWKVALLRCGYIEDCGYVLLLYWPIFNIMWARTGEDKPNDPHSIFA